MSRARFRKPTGMHDIFGDDNKYYEKIEEASSKIASFYSFDKITTPILEEAELFIRSVGEETDIVGKEMYTLKTMIDLLFIRYYFF